MFVEQLKNMFISWERYIQREIMEAEFIYLDPEIVVYYHIFKLSTISNHKVIVMSRLECFFHIICFICVAIRKYSSSVIKSHYNSDVVITDVPC